MSTTDTRAVLCLDPLDGLFFRDGRPFGAGASATSGLPLPQTLAGALRSHLMARLGCDFGRLRGALEAGADLTAALSDQGDDLAAIAGLRLFGPWLHRAAAKPAAASGPLGVMWPVPAILHQEKTDGGNGPLHLLRPLRQDPPGWTMAGAPTQRALWATSARPTEAVKGFITTDGLADILRGRAPDRDTLVSAAALFDTDRRVGLVVRGDSLTAEDGMLYSAGFLRPAPGVGFVAEVTGLTSVLRGVLDKDRVMGWGGERRQVKVTIADAPLHRPCEHGPADADGTCLILTTPAPLAKGWYGAEWMPTAAAVPTPIAISGWDLARGQAKPTRFAAPVGSVFFFDGPVPEALGDGLCDGEDRRLGYGCVLRGVWRYA